MATVLPDLQKLEEALEKQRIIDGQALLDKKPTERGVFIPANVFQQATSWSHDTDFEGITLNYDQKIMIAQTLPCPCGVCDYYAIELFTDGKWVSHHHTKGVVKRGKYK